VRTAQVVRRREDALGARVVIRIRGAQLLERARESRYTVLSNT